MSDRERPAYVRNFDPYAGLADAEVCRLAPSSSDHTIPAGSVVYDPLHPTATLYVVKKGEVALSHSVDGKETIFATLGPGDAFGDFGFTERAPDHTARATKTSILCMTPVAEFLNVIRAQPELALHFLRTLADRLQEYEGRLRTSGASARDKLYAEFVRLAEQQRRRTGGGEEAPAPFAITHEALATRTGLNRVTVTRLVAQLKDEGLIRQHANGGYEVV